MMKSSKKNKLQLSQQTVDFAIEAIKTLRKNLIKFSIPFLVSQYKLGTVENLRALWLNNNFNDI